MPIDASVIRVNPIEQPDLLGSIGKVMAIKQAAQQGQMHDLAIQQQQQQMADDQAARGVTPDMSDADLFHVVGPTKALALIKARHEAQKADFERQDKQIEIATKRTNRLGQLANGIKDQPTYESALNTAISEGLIPQDAISKIPAQYDPKTVDYFKQQALTANEALTQKRAELEMSFKQAAEARAAAMAPFTQKKAEAEATTAQLTAEGKAPIQPAQQAQIDAQKQTHADTLKYQDARLGMERQRVGLEAQRNARENQKYQMDQGALQRTAQALANGDMTRLSDVASMRGDQRLILFDMAKRINPNFNTAEVNRKIKNEEYYATGKGAENLRSFGTFLEHVGGAMDATAQIRLSSSPLINKPLNYWRKNVSGDPALVRLEAAIEPAKKEYESFLLGGHALQNDDRKVADRILNAEKWSPAQIEEALKTIAHVAQARFNEENFKYKRVSGHDLQDPFSPEAVQGAAKVGLKLGSAPAQTTGGRPPLSQFER